MAVGVQHDGQLRAGDVDGFAVAQHLQLELVQHEHLLRQVVLGGQIREVIDDAVDLLGLHVADGDVGQPVRRQLPLGVQRQADVRLLQQLLVELRLLDEIGAAGLEIDDDVSAGLGHRVDVRLQRFDGRRLGVVAARAGRSLRHGGDDLEGRDDLVSGQALVLLDQRLGVGDGFLGGLLAHHAEHRGARVAVGGDHVAPGEHQLAAAGQLRDVLVGGELDGLAELAVVAEDVAEADQRAVAARGLDGLAGGAGVADGQPLHLDARGAGGGDGAERGARGGERQRVVVAGLGLHRVGGGERVGGLSPGVRGTLGPLGGRGRLGGVHLGDGAGRVVLVGRGGGELGARERLQALQVARGCNDGALALRGDVGVADGDHGRRAEARDLLLQGRRVGAGLDEHGHAGRHRDAGGAALRALVLGGHDDGLGRVQQSLRRRHLIGDGDGLVRGLGGLRGAVVAGTGDEAEHGCGAGDERQRPAGAPAEGRGAGCGPNQGGPAFHDESTRWRTFTRSD